jgi:hypothetical protein
VFGLVSVVHLRDVPELARGELIRFLAEAAWYSTSLCRAGASTEKWRTIIQLARLSRMATSPSRRCPVSVRTL